MGVHYANVVQSLSPLAYWRFGEAVGSGSAVDSSGNGRNFSYAGKASLAQSGAIAYDPDTSIGFTSQSGSVLMGNNWPFSASDSFSWSFWLRSRASGFGWSINFGAYHQSLAGIFSGDKFWIEAYVAGAFQGNIYAPTPLNTWSFVVLTFGSDWRIYSNGQLYNSRTRPAYDFSSSLNMQIGVGTGIANFDVDEMAILGHALTAYEVAALNVAGTQKFIDLNRQRRMSA